MGNDFSPPAFFAFRSPLLPLQSLVDWAAEVEGPSAPEGERGDALARDRQRLRDRLRTVVALPEVREALFLAAPTLEAQIEGWLSDAGSERGQKTERTLVRYFARMASRSTPFGLFAGCSVGTVAPNKPTRLELVGRADYKRKTRVDMEYVCALVDSLVAQPELRAKLRYRPSTSLYAMAGQFRWAEGRVRDGQRSYHLVAADETEHLSAAIEAAMDGASPAEIARAVVCTCDVPARDAMSFVDELIAGQVLIPDVVPPVTGGDPLEALVESLDLLAVDGSVLSEVLTRLSELDRTVGNDPAAYRAIGDALSALPAPVELPRLFQVDMVKPATAANLGAEVVDDAIALVRLLHRISPTNDGTLERFKAAFLERWETQEVPLVDVLDDDNGIGFATSSSANADPSPLLAGLPFGAGEKDAGSSESWEDRDAFLFAKLEKALRTGATEIVLTTSDLDALATKDPAPLPSSLGLVTTLIGSRDDLAGGKYRLLLDGAMGPSGAKLLGRFCHADPALEGHVRDLLRAEESHAPDAIFAEVVHLPEGRSGNVIARPVLREYEIPYLGVSGAPLDKQLSLTDLVVSVREDRVVLRSRSLGREVIPCLTNAHNHMRTASTYRFLCEVARQGVTWGLGFSWGTVTGSFLPRVVHGKFVLSRARWRLAEKALAALGKGADRDVQFTLVQQLREEHSLPRWVYVVDGDNILPVDLDNALSVDSFVHLVKGRRSVTLEEMLPSPDELCVAGPEGAFAHEIVLPLTRAAAVAQAEAPAFGHRTACWPLTKRQFAPGSEWLYAKLYTGPATADRVLRELVLPVVTEVEAEGTADSWFFLRYADPHFHVRLRIHGNPEHLRDIESRLTAAAAPLLGDGRLQRIQLDTYDREIERYGGHAGILVCERIFHEDSRACLRIIDLLAGDAGLSARWQLTLRGMDQLLDDLGLDDDTKLDLARRLRKGFGEEHGVDAAFERLLGAKYRKERPAIERLFDPSAGRDHPFASGLASLRERTRKLAPLAATLRTRSAAGRLDTSLPDIGASLLHMHANRLLRSSARAQELVLYDFLVRTYESRAARKRSAQRPMAVTSR